MTTLKLSSELRRKVIELLKQNRKVEAVKVVRETTHTGLKESKDAVDNIFEELQNK
ncbi:MAG: ribosomal protein L7/L12 [Anaerolineales bacterium]|nr:ribosomal protein L7/L12 [Anaerolineales bacterium]